MGNLHCSEQPSLQPAQTAPASSKLASMAYEGNTKLGSPRSAGELGKPAGQTSPNPCGEQSSSGSLHSFVSNSRHLVEPLLAAAAGSFGNGLHMMLDDSGASCRFEISFDNSVLKPRVGKHLTCAWRAAIRCATQQEESLSDYASNRRSRAIKFVGSDLLAAVGGDISLFKQIVAVYNQNRESARFRSGSSSSCTNDKTASTAGMGAVDRNAEFHAIEDGGSTAHDTEKQRHGSTDSSASTVATSIAHAAVLREPDTRPGSPLTAMQAASSSSSVVASSRASEISVHDAHQRQGTAMDTVASVQYLVPVYLS